jgi:hypothetical protein
MADQDGRWASLPLDLLAKVFARLLELAPADKSLPRAAACRAWWLAFRGETKTLTVARAGTVALAGVSRMGSLTDLEVSCNTLPVDWWECVSGLRRLRRLSICPCPPGLWRLRRLPELSALDISWSDGGDASVAGLRRIRGLTHLSLSGTRVTPKGLRQLRSMRLRTLEAAANGIAELGWMRPVGALLTRLDLGRNPIGDAGAALAVECCPVLTSLSVDSCLIGCPGAQAIASLRELRALDISANFVQDAGGVALAACTSLESLHASTNWLGEASAVALSRLPRLRDVELDDNLVTLAGARALVAMPAVRRLLLWHNPIHCVYALLEECPAGLVLQVSSFRGAGILTTGRSPGAGVDS